MTKRVLIFLLLLSLSGAASGAAFTSKATGNWATAGQTTWNETGVPGAGDTVTINAGHTVTVTADTTVGASGNTGTVAITLSAGALVVSGCKLTVCGNILHSGSYTQTTSVTVDSGGGIVMSPPSGQQYTVDLLDSAAVHATWTFNGTAGSRCSLETDTSNGGLASYFDISGSDYTNIGVVTAAYTDFSDFGDTTHPGVRSQLNAAGSLACSITDCTFTRCSCHTRCGDSWAGNYSLARNTFTSSVTITDGLGTWGMYILFDAAPSAGTRSCTGNSFDKKPAFNRPWGMTIDNNYFAESYTVGTTGITVPWTSFAGNLIRFIVYADNAIPILGDATNNYWLFAPADGQDNNPHYTSAPGFAFDQDIDGCIFESLGADPNGDCLSISAPPSAALLTIIRCIVLPNADNDSTGTIFSAAGAANATIVCDHNTYFMGHQGAAFGETYTGHAGMLQSHRSNIAWDSSARGRKLYDVPNIDAVADYVTVADYNCGYNYLSTNPAGCTEAYSAKGYVGSATTDPFAAAPGAHDIDVDPGFLDATRNLALWGHTVHHADCPEGTVAQALAYVAAHPESIGAATTGLVAWVKAGFRPTNVALRNAGHDSATIGAMAYLETGTYTLTAPSPASGKVDTASGNFTVALAESQYPGTLVVTPAATGVAGTFTPTTVTLTDADRTKTFTFTPSATGTATIATTNDGSMTNPAGVEYVVSAAATQGKRVISGYLLNVKDHLDKKGK